jgi:hypothetical protein
MKTIYKVGLALTILWTLGQHTRADMILSHSQESVLAQSIFADLAVESAILLSGIDSSVSVAYSGTTTGSQWSGAFTDPTSGTSEGSMAGSITDPTFTIGNDSSISIGAPGKAPTPYTLTGTFSIDDTKDPATATLNFVAKNQFAGNRTWTDGGDMVVTSNKDGTFTFKGTVVDQNGKKYTAEINYSAANPLVNDQKQDIFTSSLKDMKSGKVLLVDRGKATTTSDTSFNGDVDMEIDTVPEPSGLVLGAIGFLCAAVYRMGRKRIPWQGAVEE